MVNRIKLSKIKQRSFQKIKLMSFELFFWTVLGNVLFMLSQWIGIVVISKNSSPTELGVYGYSLSIVSLILMFLNFQLKWFQGSDVKHEFTFHEYLSFRLITIIMGLIIFIPSVVFFKEQWVLLMLLFLIKSVEMLFDVPMGELQRTNKIKSIGKSLSIRSLSYIIIFLFFFSYVELEYTLIIISLSWIIQFFIDNIKIINKNIYKFSPSSVIKMIKKLYPLAIILGLNNLYLNLPRLFLSKNIEEIGVFYALYQLVFSINLGTQVILQSNIFSLSELYKEKKFSDFEKLFFKTIKIISIYGIFIFSLFYLSMPYLLEIIYNAKIASYINNLNQMLVFMTLGFIPLVFSQIFTIMIINKKEIFIWILAAIFVTIILSFNRLNLNIDIVLSTMITGNILCCILYIKTYIFHMKKVNQLEKEIK